MQLLVDFAFSWSESWVQKWEESDGQGWYLALLGSTLGMIALSITMTVLMYTNFIGHGTCSLSVFFITTNLLFAFFVCGMLPAVILKWLARSPCNRPRLLASSTFGAQLVGDADGSLCGLSQCWRYRAPFKRPTSARGFSRQPA
jgi:hypothetical protein